MERHASNSDASASIATTTTSWEEFVESLEQVLEENNDISTGHPVNPLDFPTPTISDACLLPQVEAIDHRNGKLRFISNVLVRTSKSRIRGTTEAAYLVRKKLTKTTYGAIRVGVVLKRTRGDTETGADRSHWISTDEMVVIKMSSWQKIRQNRGQQRSQEDPLREVAALQLIGNHHPNVMGCHEALQDDRSLYVIMPYFNGGNNLHGKLFGDPQANVNHGTRDDANDESRCSDHSQTYKPTEESARHIFRQLLKAIFHLQCKGIWHKDISLDNLLISKRKEICLIDFGMSLRVPYSDPCNDGCITDVSEGELRRLIRSYGNDCERPMYMAPELLAEKYAVDGFACDLWSAGIVLFLLCVGLAPFKFAAHSEKRFAKISSGGLKRLLKYLKIWLSHEACDLLQNMLWENPRDRLSLMEIMRHPWVMGEKMGADDSKMPVEEVLSCEESVGSLSSTEPTQEANVDDSNPRSTTPATTTQPSLKPKAKAAPSESRETSPEPRGTPTKRFKNLQQIGPKIVMNAQKVGPRIKHAIANVHHMGKHSPNEKGISVGTVPTAAPDASRKQETKPGSKAPYSRAVNRLKTVVPNKAAAPTTTAD